MVAVSCPQCGKILNVPQEKIGKVGRCPGCREPFTAKETIPAEAEEKPSTVAVAGQTALKTTQAIGGGLVRAGGAALEWNKARQEEKARKQAELAQREQEILEAERAELAKPVPCPFCGEPIARQARKCRHCNEYLDANLRPGAQPAAPQVVINNTNTNSVQATAVAAVGGVPRKRFSPFIAFLLSLLLPGLGQLYTGRLISGVIWFVVVAIGYVAFIIPGIVLHILCAISAGMTNPYN